jgi:hypothetical protein
MREIAGNVTSDVTFYCTFVYTKRVLQKRMLFLINSGIIFEDLLTILFRDLFLDLKVCVSQKRGLNVLR